MPCTAASAFNCAPPRAKDLGLGRRLHRACALSSPCRHLDGLPALVADVRPRSPGPRPPAPRPIPARSRARLSAPQPSGPTCGPHAAREGLSVDDRGRPCLSPSSFHKYACRRAPPGPTAQNGSARSSPPGCDRVGRGSMPRPARPPLASEQPFDQAPRRSGGSFPRGPAPAAGPGIVMNLAADHHDEPRPPPKAAPRAPAAHAPRAHRARSGRW